LVKQPLDRDRGLGRSRAATGTETDSCSEAASDFASKSLQQFASSRACARPAIGHAAAPPGNDMNSQRFS
jgi:hypothetical protein